MSFLERRTVALGVRDKETKTWKKHVMENGNDKGRIHYKIWQQLDTVYTEIAEDNFIRETVLILI